MASAVAPGVRRLLRRCLEKDPKSRLRDIADARFAIEDGAHDAERTTAAPAGNRFRRMWFALGSTVLAIALVAAWWTGRRSAAPPTGGDNPLADAKFTRFTDLPGSEWDASISPDGKFVVFQSDSAGHADVWLSQVGTGGFTNLTQGRLVTGDLFVRNMGISHDGSEVRFAGRFPDRRLKRMPLLGGTPSNFLQEHSVNLAWSPDGARLAYHTGEPGDPMFVADRNGGSPRKIFVNPRPAGIIISRSGRAMAGGSTSSLASSTHSKWICGASGPRANRRSVSHITTTTSRIRHRSTRARSSICHPQKMALGHGCGASIPNARSHAASVMVSRSTPRWRRSFLSLVARHRRWPVEVP